MTANKKGIHSTRNPKSDLKTGKTSTHPMRYCRIKRAMDVVLCGTALFFLSPALLGISIAIKLDSKDPYWYP